MKHIKNILVYMGTDESQTSLRRALDLATENGAKLTLMDVVKPVPNALSLITDTASPSEIEQLVVEDHRHKLLQQANQLSETSLSINAVVSVGDPATEIIRQVLVGQHDLVFKTADSESGTERMFGGVARALLRLCPCPVWILKPEVHGAFDRVLAAVDLGAADQPHVQLNDEILDLAQNVARAEHAELHLVAAWDLWMEGPLRRRAGDDEINKTLEAMELKMQRALDELLNKTELDKDQVTVHLHRGIASSVILAMVEQVAADLVVMGTVCRTGVSGFLIGNTAENVLSSITCSVLAIKPEGFASPIVPAAQ